MKDTPDAHARHDRLLMAALASGDLSARERAFAERRLRECDECASLASELSVLTEALASIRGATPTRPRDFRLTERDTERNRPSGIRRLLGALAGPRAGLLQPLGAAALSIGVVLVLVSSLAAPFAAAPRGQPAAQAPGGEITTGAAISATGAAGTPPQPPATTSPVGAPGGAGPAASSIPPAPAAERDNGSSVALPTALASGGEAAPASARVRPPIATIPALASDEAEARPGTGAGPTSAAATATAAAAATADRGTAGDTGTTVGGPLGSVASLLGTIGVLLALLGAALLVTRWAARRTGDRITR